MQNEARDCRTSDRGPERVSEGAGHDLGHAFTVSLLQLGALAAGIVVMSRLLPKPRAAAAVDAEPDPVAIAA